MDSVGSGLGIGAILVMLLIGAVCFWLGTRSNAKAYEEKTKRYTNCVLLAIQDPRIKELLAFAVAEVMNTPQFKGVVTELFEGKGVVPRPEKVYYEDLMKEREQCRSAF